MRPASYFSPPEKFISSPVTPASTFTQRLKMAFNAYTPKVRVQKPAPAFSGTAVVDGTFEGTSALRMRPLLLLSLLGCCKCRVTTTDALD